MEGISSSRPEHLVLLVSKLKEVFDMCDEDEDGFIRVEHFVHLGRQFGQTDEEVKLTCIFFISCVGCYMFSYSL